LVADDDPHLQAFLQKLLSGDRYELLQTATGKETVACLHQPGGAHCDALLLDLMMPAGSGSEVLRSIQHPDAAGKPTVLVLTNWPEPRAEEERALLQSAPVLAVLEKSTVLQDPQHLLRHLDAICRHGSPLASEGRPMTALCARASRLEVA
jgi:DNA-binding response OmpR family regulator